MKEITGEVRTLHPGAIVEIGERYCIVLLEIGRDLESGKIPSKEFNMLKMNLPTKFFVSGSCGSPCCIIGHVRIRAQDDDALGLEWIKSTRLQNLFCFTNPSDPIKAARAIERYVYEYAENPWQS